jgi:imidazolonepropionase
MSMPLVMTLACSTLGMSPDEAFMASTWNAAWATGLGGKAGALTRDTQPTRSFSGRPTTPRLPYRFGVSLVDKLVKKGQVVYKDKNRERRI